MKNLNLWRIVVGALLVSLLGVGAWGMTRVATMSDRHPAKSDYVQHVDNANRKFDAVQKSISEQGKRMEDKLDKIQEHLMK